MGEAIMFMLLAAAGVCDIREKKIPNVLILSGWFLGLWSRLWQEGFIGILCCVAAALITIGVGCPLFWIRAVGAGDVKLLSVIGGMHGLRFLFSVSVVWLIAAGVVSAVKLLRNGILVERFRHFWQYFMTGRGKEEAYYCRDRDGTGCTVILAPILAVAYILVIAGRWGEIC